MAEIRKWDDPVLSTACDPVEPGERLTFLDDMRSACRREKGVGLAAPQIGITKQVIYVAPTYNNDMFMINPQITEYGSEMETATEGCLSFPGVFVPILRPKSVTVTWEDLKRRRRTQTFSGLTARVIQHECDHLAGLCRVKEAAQQLEAGV